MKKQIVAFTGPSNSGKTTLIVKLSQALQAQGFKVCIVKHDPKDKASFDQVGKDSYKFSQTNADVAVVSPQRTTLFKQSTSSINQIAQMFGDFDYLLVEGLKTLKLPRIAIFRNEIEEDYLSVCEAIAVDNSIDKKNLPSSHNILDLNSIEDIIKWIDLNALKI